MKFRHLKYADRVAMETLLNRGCSKAEVARYLHVSRATITREYFRDEIICELTGLPVEQLIKYV